MRNSLTSSWLAGAAFGAAVVLCPALASAQPPPRGSDQSAPTPNLPGVTPETPGGDAAEGSPPKKIAETIPDSAVERAKMLDNFYALLATAEDEQKAEQTANAITRLWAVSGSDTVTVLMARALKSLQDKNNALALRLLDAVVDQAPDFAEGWSQRAHLLYLDNQVQRAVGDLRRALALDPNHFRAMSALGHILREVGEKKGALMAYRKLLEIHPYAEGAQKAADDLQREIGGQGI
jgi:tetratricopeptide (TPR) repeat protein